MTSEPKSLLLVDAGNTRIKLALCAASAGSALPECTMFVAVRDDQTLPWSEIAGWSDPREGVPHGVITGSNPSQIDRVVREWPAAWGRPQVMTDRRELSIVMDVDAPDRVGIDRLLNAVAANRVRKSGQPAIVIDVGTATTVDAISVDGVFLGGAIIAGPELTARALHEYTAVLPHVTLDDLAETEPPVIGRNTREAIASGLYWGHWQSVWSYCVRMMEPLGVGSAPQTILTGGAAHLFVSRLSPAHTYLPHLTLQGLAVAALSGRLRWDEG